MNDLEKRLANFRIEEGYRKERERRVRADDAATITQLTAERDRLRESLDKAISEVLRLTTQRDRLRKALGEIIYCDHHNFYDGPPPRYVQIARAAQEETRE